MRIYTDRNDLRVNAISTLGNETNVEGHYYQVLAGANNFAIEFQQGNPAEHGVNGVTNEAVLAILLHRTKFLNAKFPCPENENAIGHMEQALHYLEARTAARIDRGVEGQEVA